jgi:CrcB protein
VSVWVWIVIGAAGGLVAVARHLVSSRIDRATGERFPVGILVVNLLGALAIGMVAGSTLDGDLLVIVAGGGIGSFTTFSTWMLDVHRLRARGSGKAAALNLALPQVLGLVAVLVGRALA